MAVIMLHMKVGRFLDAMSASAVASPQSLTASARKIGSSSAPRRKERSALGKSATWGERERARGGRAWAA